MRSPYPRLENANSSLEKFYDTDRTSADSSATRTHQAQRGKTARGAHGLVGWLRSLATFVAFFFLLIAINPMFGAFLSLLLDWMGNVRYMLNYVSPFFSYILFDVEL